MDCDSNSNPDVSLQMLHDGPCSFQYVKDKPGILACTLGCQKTQDVNSLTTSVSNQNRIISNEVKYQSNDAHPTSYIPSPQGQSGRDLSNFQLSKRIKRFKAAKRIVAQFNNQFPQGPPQQGNIPPHNSGPVLPSQWQQPPKVVPFSPLVPPPNLQQAIYPNSSRSMPTQGQGYSPYGFKRN